MDGTEKLGEPTGEVDTDEIFSAVCQWYGYSVDELTDKLTYDQVSELYIQGVKREQLQRILQAEMSYQAIVVAMSAVLNKAYGGDGDIPETLGLLDAWNNNSQPSAKNLKYYKEGAPDVLSIF